MKILNRKIDLPERIFAISLLFVLLSFLAFYLIDLRNIYGARDALFETSGAYFFFSYQPFFFQHWGRNSGFAEIIQWTFLGGSSVVASFCAAKMHNVNKKLFRFWIIISIAFLLMLIEDAGNLRHTLMSYIQWIFEERDQGIMGTLTEFTYFAILGGIPLYALIRYWSEIKNFTKTKIYLLIGFAFYALAASLSFLGTALEGLLPKNLYTVMGERFYEFALTLGDPQLQSIWEEWNSGSWFKIEFFLFDSLIEENLEIIASGALLAACVAFLLYITKERGKRGNRTNHSPK